MKRLGFWKIEQACWGNEGEPSPSRNIMSLWLKGQNAPFLERPSFYLANPNEKRKTLQSSTFLKGDKMVRFSACQFDTRF